MAPRKFGTTRLDEGFSQAIIDAVWNKGSAVAGYDANLYRKDMCGAWMKKDMRGDTKPGGYGWEIDHIVAVANGGSDELNNLQPLQWQNNRAKSDNGAGQWKCAMR